jgi:hypothetical protein
MPYTTCSVDVDLAPNDLAPNDAVICEEDEELFAEAEGAKYAANLTIFIRRYTAGCLSSL